MDIYRILVNNFTNSPTGNLYLNFITKTVNQKHTATELKAYSLTPPVLPSTRIGAYANCKAAGHGAVFFLEVNDLYEVLVRNFANSTRTLQAYEVLIIGY